MVETVSLDQAAAWLHTGRVLAYPTEAVWGVGCDPDDARALEALLALKQRDPAKGVILIAASIEQCAPYLDGLTSSQRETLAAHWPGPTTFLVPDNGRAHPLVRGAHSSIALRVTDHPLVIELCTAFGGPLVSTSANQAGAPPCMSAEDILAHFPSAHDLAVLDGALGGRAAPSRIVDLDSGRVLR
ncbi:Sua5/YciO/YrdC/YwlC family protein [Larsenimonas suaedae]|uniref:Threonylcarbamoyl-AMP synthase n=1 Tax=Larsenimonas suaedae TaxID=1851019 RepID=A0ABU1GU47_9GAMM|nr:Sua5/YciO/YrdC/YwlC family protein [Larsenimonas suaedae]MCM2972094.1 Sua5/YciO/YrdC/YwlC family protein [Larsenimonas suaedae]MDR5895112.1 Sua5/YciO/YrdC/YwlC family protein [Larsenimonas suaedae]